MAAPVYQSLSQSDSGNTDTVTATVPSGTAQGDFLIAFVGIDVTTTTVTAAGSGYSSLLGPQDGGNGDERIYVYTKTAGASEGNTTWTIGTARNWSVVLVRISGAHATTPVDDSASGTGSAANSTAQPLPSGVVTTVADTLAVAFICSDRSSVTPPELTAPTSHGGWTERLDAENAGANMVLGVSTVTIASASTTVAGDYTMAGSDRAAVATVVVAPSAGGVTGTATGLFGGTFTASGIPKTFGSGVASFGFTGTANGQPRTFGVAVANLGFTGDASGTTTVTVFGTGTGLFGFTGTALGQPRTLGVASASFGFTGTALGIDRALGVATATFGFTGNALGIDRALGLANANLGFTGNALGVITTTVIGSGTGLFGFTGTSSGLRKTFGSISTLFQFTALGSGTGSEPLFIFEPPTYEAPMRTLLKPVAFFRLTESQSVVKVNGHYINIKTPNSDQLTAAGAEGIDWFIGGHIYTVPQSVADALIADGYTVS